MNELFPHQERGASRIANNEPTYLALDMGIGKTRTFIEGARRLKAARVLVTCPASALLVWKREITLWDPTASFVIVRSPRDLDRPAAYHIVSHGLMSQKDSPVVAKLATGSPFNLTAIDEAHAFNSADSNRVKALRRLLPKLGRIVPLSGTPMRNHAGDLYTLIASCWPQGLKYANGKMMLRTEFEDLFCRVNHRSFGGRPPVRVIEGSKNLAQLKTLIAPFMMRVRKDEVFKDLPAILWDTVPVPLDPQHFIGAEADVLIAALKQLDGEHPDAIVEALGRVSTSLAGLRRMLGLAKLRGSIEYIIDMLDNLPPDRKVLIFAHHTHVIGALARHLGEFLPAVIVGSTSGPDREKAVNQFLTDENCRVFIGNIQAAGTAITLVGPKCKCSDVIFVESSWTPMDNAQAACRVHRIGQKDGVVARMLTASGTVDDIINAILVRKAREFTQLFDTQNVGETK